MNNCRAVLVFTAVVVILTCGYHDVSALELSTIGSVQFINGDIVEGVIIRMCRGPDGRHVGPGFIGWHGSVYYQIEINDYSHGWWCDFVYRNSGNGVLHTAHVQVWQGIWRSADGIPCTKCIWRIQTDGFYRADNCTEHFRLIARWN